MQKDTERIDSHSASNARLVWAQNIAGPHDDVRNPEPIPILGDDFVLFDFCEAIGVTSEYGMLFYWAILIQQPPSRFPRVRVNRERADADESTQALVIER